MSGCLVVAGAYRLANIHITSDPLAASTKAKFYVLLSLMEWLVTAALFAVNARVMFAEDLAIYKKKAAKHTDSARGEHVALSARDPASPAPEFKDPYTSAWYHWRQLFPGLPVLARYVLVYLTYWHSKSFIFNGGRDKCMPIILWPSSLKSLTSGWTNLKHPLGPLSFARLCIYAS